MRVRILLLAASCLAGCGGPGSEATVAEKPVDPMAGLPAGVREKLPAIRQAIQAFAAELRGELSAAIEKGGATLAIGVCRDRAPEIARRHSERLGGTLGRTSLRVRNTDNEPDDWEISVMEKFASLQMAGRDPARLETAEVVPAAGGGSVLRYAKAIPMDTLCLTCHGEDIIAPVKATVESLYPGDQATGFKEGELRGMFTVDFPLGKGDADPLPVPGR